MTSMSSRKTARGASSRGNTRPRSAKLAGGTRKAADAMRVKKAEAKKPSSTGALAVNGASADAKRLAATIERDLREGRHDTLSREAFQNLMAALCKSYGTQIEAGANFLPVPA